MSKLLKTVEEVVRHFGSLPQHKDLQMKFGSLYTKEDNGVKHFVPFPVFLKRDKTVSDNELYAAMTALGYSKKDLQKDGFKLYFNGYYGQRISATKSKKPSEAFKNEFLRGLDTAELIKLGQSGQLFAEIDKAWADEPAGNTTLDVEITEDVHQELNKLRDAEIENLY